MKWNSNLYDDKHAFVAEYGRSMMESVNREPGQKILDLGCGTGILTNELAKKGADVTGTDLSPDMIKKARVNYPELHFQVEDAVNLPFQNKFDTVFSNAVFHWIPEQEKLLSSVHRALKNGGTLMCEFGAKGNIAHIRTAFEEAAGRLEYACHSSFFFPSGAEYSCLLRQAGFEVTYIREYDRPTPLADGENGLRNWLRQFFADDLAALREEQREIIYQATEDACRSHLWQSGQWIADYRRIQAAAVKKA